MGEMMGQKNNMPMSSNGKIMDKDNMPMDQNGKMMNKDRPVPDKGKVMDKDGMPMHQHSMTKQDSITEPAMRGDN